MTDPQLAGGTLPDLDARRGSADVVLADDGRSYTVVRLLGAPPARVFRAFTEPDDLRRWFPAGAPEGSTMPTCASDAREGGHYHYEMVVPGFGPMAWHGTYTAVQPPDSLSADEWFVVGEGEPSGEPSRQTLTFDAVDGGTRLTMVVHVPTPEDPDEFMEQSAAGLGSSLDAMDVLVSG